MTERVLTPEKLIEMIESAPANPKASGVGVLQSGNEIRIVGTINIVALTAKINAWASSTEETER